MWNQVFRNASVDGLVETIKFAERRHQLLASNLANLDTPDYQTQDLSVSDFQEALGESIEATKRADKSNVASSDAVEGVSAEQAQKHVRKAFEQILYHDGSDVSYEQQVASISKNQAMHSTAVTILRTQMKQLQMAISESVNV